MKKNPNIIRNGNDVISNIDISVVDAVLGKTIDVKTIYN